MLLTLGSRSRPPLEPRACTLRATSLPTRQALASRISPPTSVFSPMTSPRCSSAASTPHAAPPRVSLRPPPIPGAPVAWPLLERPPRGGRSPVGVLGVPMDLGQDRRGVDMGPSAIRYARLQTALVELGYPVADLGNAEVPIPEMVGKQEEVKHLGVVRDVCAEVAERAGTMVSEGLLPIFLGGDHSIAIGTVSGVAKALSGVRTGVIWLDAHADFNIPETSPSGNIHGMPLSALTGRGHPDLVSVGGQGASVRTEDVVIIGLRSVDLEEKNLLREAGVKVYTMREVDV